MLGELKVFIFIFLYVLFFALDRLCNLGKSLSHSCIFIFSSFFFFYLVTGV